MFRYVLVLLVLFFTLGLAQPPLINGSYLEEELELSERIFLGDADAPISVVVFEDFACPHCRTFNLEYFPRFKEEFIDTGYVKLFHFSFPIPVSRYSEKAAVAAECIKEQDTESFWTYKETLYESSLLYGPVRGEITAGKFWNIAINAQLSNNLFKTDFFTCLDSDWHLGQIASDRQLGIDLGVQGTPAMLIDTEAILNPNQYDLLTSVLRDYIDELKGLSANR